MNSLSPMTNPAPGVTFEEGRYLGTAFHLVRVQPTAGSPVLKPYLTDRFEGEALSRMNSRSQAVVSINGTFFDTAAPGQTVYGEIKTDSQSRQPSMVKKRTYLAVKQDGSMVMDETVPSPKGQWGIPPEKWQTFRYVMGGGGRLIKDGLPTELGVGNNDEKFQDDVIARRNRSAIGFAHGGRELLLVSCDEAGWTPQETADFMKHEGATEAMFLDGGGSTEMIVADKRVTPLSAGAERSLATALVLEATNLRSPV